MSQSMSNIINRTQEIRIVESVGSIQNSVDERKMLRKRENKHSEKQISIDPISLRDSTHIHNSAIISGPMLNFLMPPTPKNKLSSSSLPNSASSSPHFDSKQKKKSKNHHGTRLSTLARQQSVALTNLERLRESHLQRSKSCGEGRASRPSIDFDLWSNTKMITYHNEIFESKGGGERLEQAKVMSFNKKKGGKEMESYEDNFKCGALCLFLPAFGKGKPVRARKELDHEQVGMGLGDLVSHRASLEKFECRSWKSSVVINNEEDRGDVTSNLFFDLPVELIRSSTVNDTDSPITTAFLFDNKDILMNRQRKGVLKSSAAATNVQSSESSNSSSRHVRFSTSSPTMGPTSPTSSCVTPHLRKARDEFSAFLDAQSA